MGSTECVPNPHAPDLDVCELTEDDRDRLHELGYRRIPGDRCTGGWEPPRRNQTITRKLLNCPSKLDTYLSVGSKVVGIFVALTVAVLFVLFLLRWRFRDCHTRRHTSICPIDCKRLMRWPRKANVFHHISNGDGLANEGIATISFSRPPTATLVDMNSTFTEASVRASPKPGMMTSVLQQMSLRSKRKAEDKRGLLGEENMPGMLTPPEDNEGPF
ncbi:unnamed protein product [Dibothriocephalus latus]|uniref:Uncharacterized protein n=1 Tax=Dibothriocephalus latus TaxID=60516 RepID=A0A3P6T476_DIBLA|nr:unnamed protein product [Dibothriocephalus latus]